MLERDLLAELLTLAMSRGGDFADIYLEHKTTTGIGCEANKIEKIQSGIDAGAGIRVISGETTAYVYTNNLTREGLTKAAEVVSHAASGAKKDVVLDFRVPQPRVEFEIKERPDLVPVARKIQAVEEINTAARQVDPDQIKQVMVGYGDVIQQVTIANSDGLLVNDERIRTRLAVNAVAAIGSNIQTGYEAIGGIQGFELVEQSDLRQLGEAAAGRAIKMLSAKAAPAGKMPVVIAAEAGGTMVHEACGHGLEADLAQKGLSVYAGKKGQQVASSEVSVVDDATLNHKYGSLRFDDEGMPGEKNVLIKDGVLETYMYDRITAAKDRCPTSGNGRRESYQNRPIPRMTNTCIVPGRTSPEQIIRAVKEGLLVKKMGGGQVNTTNGDFVFDVAEGYLIKDGEISVPVKGATLTGNGPEVLNLVEMVGSDLGFAIGTCGKDGQGVPVADAQPTLLIKEMVVGGTDTLPGANAQIRRVAANELHRYPVKRL